MAKIPVGLTNADGKTQCQSIAAKTRTQSADAAATTVEQQLRALERAAGILPEGDDQGGRDRRIALLKRLNGL